jgi:hypothetical protein
MSPSGSSGGGGGGAGGGYNIPVSTSLATTTSFPLNTDANWNIQFSSPDSPTNLTSSQQANPVQPATAVASAANGPSSASAQGTGVGTSGTPGASLLGGLDTNTLLLVGGGIVAIVLLIVFLKR